MHHFNNAGHSITIKCSVCVLLTISIQCTVCVFLWVCTRVSADAQ